MAQVNDKNWVFFRADLTMPQSLKYSEQLVLASLKKKQQRVQFTEEKKEGFNRYKNTTWPVQICFAQVVT